MPDQVRAALDTNIVLYAFDKDADAKHDIAAGILRAAYHCDVVLPLQVCNEAFHALVRRFRMPSRQAALICTTLIQELRIAEPDAGQSAQAMRLCADHGVRLWDALIVVAAAAGGAGLLISEDMQDGRVFTAAQTGTIPVQVLNPFTPGAAPTLRQLGLLGAP